MKVFASLLAAITLASAAIALADPKPATTTTAPPEKGSGEIKGEFSATQKQWTPGEYRLAPQARSDSLTVKQGVARDSVGQARDYRVEPGTITATSTSTSTGTSTATTAH